MIISMEETRQKLAETERATRKRKKDEGKKKRAKAIVNIEMDDEDIEDDFDNERVEIDDYIEVQLQRK